MKRSCYEVGKEMALCSDEYLLSSAKLGEHSAFMELSGRSMPKLLRVLNRITRNSEDAEDASQEALMKAFTHLKTFDGRSSFSTWLTRIAINSAFVTLRRRRKFPDVSLDADQENHDEPGMQLADFAPDPEYVCLQNERRRHLKDAIQRLSPALRKSIEIRHTKDSSVREIAANTGVSITATKSRLLRAQRILTRFLSTQNRRREAVNGTFACELRGIAPKDQ
jgi:RNA polymerase sigma factor (sigma-70 family)